MGLKGCVPTKPMGSVFLAELWEVTPVSPHATKSGQHSAYVPAWCGEEKQGTTALQGPMHMCTPSHCAATGTSRVTLLFAWSQSAQGEQGTRGTLARGAHVCTGEASESGRGPQGGGGGDTQGGGGGGPWGAGGGDPRTLSLNPRPAAYGGRVT